MVRCPCRWLQVLAGLDQPFGDSVAANFRQQVPQTLPHHEKSVYSGTSGPCAPSGQDKFTISDSDIELCLPLLDEDTCSKRRVTSAACHGQCRGGMGSHTLIATVPPWKIDNNIYNVNDKHNNNNKTLMIDDKTNATNDITTANIINDLKCND
jgi:hypothetical protein